MVNTLRRMDAILSTRLTHFNAFMMPSLFSVTSTTDYEARRKC